MKPPVVIIAKRGCQLIKATFKNKITFFYSNGKKRNYALDGQNIPYILKKIRIYHWGALQNKEQICTLLKQHIGGK